MDWIGRCSFGNIKLIRPEPRTTAIRASPAPRCCRSPSCAPASSSASRGETPVSTPMARPALPARAMCMSCGESPTTARCGRATPTWRAKASTMPPQRLHAVAGVVAADEIQMMGRPWRAAWRRARPSRCPWWRRRGAGRAPSAGRRTGRGRAPAPTPFFWCSRNMWRRARTPRPRRRAGSGRTTLRRSRRLLPAAIGEDGAYLPVTGSLPEFSIRNFARSASPPATNRAACSVSPAQVW